MQLSALITELEEFVFLCPYVKVGVSCAKQSEQLWGFRSLTGYRAPPLRPSGSEVYFKSRRH